jgi:hypothetical protein
MFALTKNVGLSIQSGYLQIFNSFKFSPVNEIFFILLQKGKIFYKLLTLLALTRFWRQPGKAIKIKKQVLLHQIKPYVLKRFLRVRFNMNKFFNILFHNRFSRRRKY